MKVIKLSPADEEMTSRKDVLLYFQKTLKASPRVGRFGVTEAKSKMKGVHKGTLLLFTYQTECMFIGRATGDIVHTGQKDSPAYIPLDMGTVQQVAGSLRDLEQELHDANLTKVKIVRSRNWPEIPDACEPFILRHFSQSNLKNLAEPPEIQEAKAKLHQVMLSLFDQAGREVGYWGRYYLRDVKNKGGYETAKEMLAPRKGGDNHKGFQALVDSGRADELSVEAIVLRPEFRQLFSAEDLAEAKRRLDGALKQIPVSPDKVYPDEVPDAETYVEGALKRVTVNAYERDPKARKACLTRFGYHCAVCGMNFENEYGPTGKDFIHVHHKRPLAMRRKEYVLNPIKDLVPVCPNCHAMLHKRNPPLTIEQLTTIRAKQAR